MLEQQLNKAISLGYGRGAVTDEKMERRRRVQHAGHAFVRKT